jgi:transposase
MAILRRQSGENREHSPRATPGLSPRPKPPDRSGRKRLDDRRWLVHTLLILKTGIGWEDLPLEMGFGSGMTCWRHPEYRTRRSVWRRLYESLLVEEGYAGEIDWSHAAVDSAIPRARGEREHTGPSPVDQCKPGSKHFAAVDAEETPLATRSTVANRPECLGVGARGGREPARTRQAGPAVAARRGVREPGFNLRANRETMRRWALRRASLTVALQTVAGWAYSGGSWSGTVVAAQFWPAPGGEGPLGTEPTVVPQPGKLDQLHRTATKRPDC